MSCWTSSPLILGGRNGHDSSWSSRPPRDEIAINDIYAELSVRYATIEAADAMLRDAGLSNAAIPRSALFLAGKVFQRYRSAGGIRPGVLPDFLSAPTR